MNEIIRKQNLENQIFHLAAMRKIYSNVKKAFLVNFILSVLIPVIFSILNLVLKLLSIDNYHTFTSIIMTYGVIMFILNYFIVNHISSCKKKAATIQEQFDTSVFGIPWNKTLVRSKVSTDEIYKHAHSYLSKNGEASLRNWYLNTSLSLPIEIQILLCQSKNLGWDANLKKITSRILIGISASSLVILLIIGILSGSSLNIFIATLAVNLPIYAFCLKYVSENNSVISKMSEIRKDVEQFLSDISESKLYNKKQTQIFIRSIQDMIFTYRSTGNPAPDKMHKLLRKKDEEHYDRLFYKYEKELSDVIETT